MAYEMVKINLEVEEVENGEVMVKLNTTVCKKKPQLPRSNKTVDQRLLEKGEWVIKEFGGVRKMIRVW
jgi:hypothetical protein